MRRRDHAMTAEQARTILGVDAGADAGAVGRAYRSAVKQAHPDHGGDAERLGQVLEAHRLLIRLARVRSVFAARRAAAPAASTPAPPPSPAPAPQLVRLSIGLEEALFGAVRPVEAAGGRRLQVRLPAGVRAGEQLRLKGAGPGGADVLVRVELKPEPGVSLKGADIWLEVHAPARRLREGQKLEVDTPRGRRAFAAPKVIEAEALVRLKGEGLPARGRHPQGDLILRLTLQPEPRPGARELLRRFSARWAA
jgi:curved DNA-binding protein